MKKGFMVVLAVLISVAFVTTVFAQAQKDAKPAAPAAAPAKDAKPAAPAAAPAPEKKAEAPKAQEFKGEFVSADAKAKTLVAKDDKGEATFDVSKVKKLAKFAAGDKIVVKYTEKDGKKVASSVKKAPAEKKDAAKKDEKPAAAAAPAAPAKAAPAPAAAPAAPAKK